jgi:hypothetical protein
MKFKSFITESDDEKFSSWYEVSDGARVHNKIRPFFDRLKKEFEKIPEMTEVSVYDELGPYHVNRGYNSSYLKFKYLGLRGITDHSRNGHDFMILWAAPVGPKKHFLFGLHDSPDQLKHFDQKDKIPSDKNVKKPIYSHHPVESMRMVKDELKRMAVEADRLSKLEVK